MKLFGRQNVTSGPQTHNNTGWRNSWEKKSLQDSHGKHKKVQWLFVTVPKSFLRHLYLWCSQFFSEKHVIGICRSMRFSPAVHKKNETLKKTITCCLYFAACKQLETSQCTVWHPFPLNTNNYPSIITFLCILLHDDPWPIVDYSFRNPILFLSLPAYKNN